MKGIYWGWVLSFLCSISLNAQNRTHKVVAGETVVSLAQKYQVTPYDLYKVNPEAKNGLKPAMVLVLPPNAVVPKTKATPAVATHKPNTTTAQTPVPATHTVLAKETVFSISKKYGLPAGALEAMNPQLKANGLQTGMVLVLKKGVPAPKPMPAPSTTEITHVVQAQETKYGIAPRYGSSVSELEAQNPTIADSLPVGAVLKIKKSTSKPAPIVTEPIKNKPVETLSYTVQNGETVFSLSRQFGLSEAALLRLNPELKDGLKEGMVLQVPLQVSFAKNRTDSGIKDLSQSANTQKRRELVLFLPFNATKIQNDTVTGVV
ncbi:MAG: LysM peptidoglycan-binding domain-containing protein, partial [Flavobacterium sp.]